MYFCNNENCENVTKDFHQACIKGDLKKVTNILRKKEEINVKQLDKNDTLYRTIGKGYSDTHYRTIGKRYSEIVKLMLKLGVNVNEKERFFGNTPFQIACAIGLLPIAKLLLENGADIDANVNLLNGAPTSLHTAVIDQNAAIAKLLLENGCKTEVRNQKGLTGFEDALEKDYFAMVKLVAFHD